MSNPELKKEVTEKAIHYVQLVRAQASIDSSTMYKHTMDQTMRNSSQLLKDYEYAEDRIHPILSTMETYGGSFVKGLAHLYYKSDSVNRAIIKIAFNNYFDKYEKMAEEVSRNNRRYHT